MQTATLILLVAANLRAPVVVPTPPSSAIDAAEGLVVLRETLNFDCSEAACEVHALYVISAKTALEVKTAFIAPERAEIRAEIDDKALTVGEAQKVDIGERGGWRAPKEAYSVPLAFSVSAGEHRLSVKYTQALGSEEVGHSYFSDGDTLRTWRYLTGPLSDWSRDKAFHIAVTARVPAGSAGFLNLFDARSVHCRSAVIRDGDQAPNIVHAARSVRKKKEAHWEHSLRFDDVPDALDCRIGPPSALPNVAGED